MYQPEELETKTAWMIGSKLKSEPEFFIQIIFNLSQKQRLWHRFLHDGEHDFFIKEIEVPIRLKPEIAPF